LVRIIVLVLVLVLVLGRLSFLVVRRSILRNAGSARDDTRVEAEK